MTSGAVNPSLPNGESAGGLAAFLVRCGVGGTLMGMANLVPGISGGTMLLASGIYPQFVQAMADVTRVRFTVRSVLTLAVVGLAAGLSILLLAGTFKTLVVHQRWAMYSVFIGLTVGGLPLVWRLTEPGRGTVWWGGAIGFAGMAVLAIAQSGGLGSAGSSSNPIMLSLAGLAGAAAMILPGLSGGYLLLLLGQYLPILSAIDRFRNALSIRDVNLAVEVGLYSLAPVGVGVVVGVVVVSNAMRFLLSRYRQPTLGVLMGLLLGAVVGLWPFREPVEPALGSTVKGVVMTAESVMALDPEDYPTALFRPSPGQLGGSGLLVCLGLAATWGISRIDSGTPR